MGLFTDAEKVVAQGYVNNITAFITAGDYYNAYATWDEFLNGDLHSPAYFATVTGLSNYYNINQDVAPDAWGYYAPFVQEASTRAAIHVGDTPFIESTAVEFALASDVMFSQKANLEYLLTNGFKVCVYAGQLDVIVGLPLNELYLATVAWPGQGAYLAANKTIWNDLSTTPPTVAGYVRTAGVLTQIAVRGAGHILPWDQPVRALDMITRFVEGSAWN
jgi:vitellogenic carboxypeptidase-like protein